MKTWLRVWRRVRMRRVRMRMGRMTVAWAVRTQARPQSQARAGHSYRTAHMKSSSCLPWNLVLGQLSNA